MDLTDRTARIQEYSSARAEGITPPTAGRLPAQNNVQTASLEREPETLTDEAPPPRKTYSKRKAQRGHHGHTRVVYVTHRPLFRPVFRGPFGRRW